MYTEEQFIKLYKKRRTEYFKKYFLKKNIHEAMYETSKNIILDLTAVQTQICMFVECLNVIRHDKANFSKLDKTTQRILRSNIVGYNLMRKDLDNILKPIINGLNDEMQ